MPSIKFDCAFSFEFEFEFDFVLIFRRSVRTVFHEFLPTWARLDCVSAIAATMPSVLRASIPGDSILQALIPASVSQLS